jgi:hypothetical protein
VADVIASQSILQSVVDWAREAQPELQSSYAFVPAGKTESLPDVVASFATIEVTFNDPRFALLGIQQTMIRTWAVGLSVMIDNSDPEAAATWLNDTVDLFTASLLSDSTLGDRVPFASPLVVFDLSRPFVRYDDGTKGREMTVDLTLGEMVEAQ